MNRILKIALGATTLLLASQAFAQVTFYEGEGFRGRAFTTDKRIGDFSRIGFNDRASSVVVEKGRWEACEDARFGGRCVVLKRGSYESLAGMGMENRISSVRPVDARARYENDAPEPLAAPTYDYRRRPNERMYEARVDSVREVRGTPEERCWVEHQPGESRRGDVNIGGGVAGALIGGVLGHQVGNGRGNDVATVGGALAGAAIGSNVGRGGEAGGRDVRRCENVSSGTPAYWDVTYDFRGTQHRVQMSARPGATITVNQAGEPRG
ncbi:MAG TPA: beta/gamma crystallin-related protein [Usitatibacter sp.]|nr:beta/gamma crystallin-related protein [Usitatibacter sp.]